jgi:hypothetical protein
MRFQREQYLDLMTFGDASRPMFVELFGLLIGLEGEWHREGATQDEIDLVAFDWDCVEVVPWGGQCGPLGGEKEVVLEESQALVSIDVLALSPCGASCCR